MKAKTEKEVNGETEKKPYCPFRSPQEMFGITCKNLNAAEMGRMDILYSFIIKLGLDKSNS